MGGGGVVLPNVSLCEDNNKVYYNPLVKETKLVVYYDIQDISSPTTIFTNYETSVKSFEVDGETISEFSQGDVTYQFDSVGEHIIKYEFNDLTTVGNHAPLFYNLTTIKRVIITDTFTSIGQNAFNSCSGLTEVTIPNSITSIGDSAFNNCSSLTSVTIPNSVTSIGTYVFNNCSGLTSVTISNSVTSIGDYTFFGCRGLTSVTIPDSVTSISERAFNNCSSLTSVTIPNSVTSIGQSAFQYCSGLTNVTIGSNVSTIGGAAFQRCNGLRAITSLATTAPTINSYTFQDVATNGTLTVQQGSTGYDTWMGTGNFYLGKYGWTKVEQ